MRKLHTDEQAVTSLFEAAYLAYHKYSLVKVAVGTSNQTWTFLCPELDFDLIKAELANADTKVYLTGYIQSLRDMMDIQSLARRNAGEWCSDEWRKIVQGR